MYTTRAFQHHKGSSLNLYNTPKCFLIAKEMIWFFYPFILHNFLHLRLCEIDACRVVFAQQPATHPQCRALSLPSKPTLMHSSCISVSTTGIDDFILPQSPFHWVTTLPSHSSLTDSLTPGTHNSQALSAALVIGLRFLEHSI